MKKETSGKPTKGEATRARILRTAIRMISDQGPDAVSMESIAAELGLTKPLLYYYFRNKEALIEKVFEETSRESAGDWAARLDPAVTLEQLVRGMISSRMKFFRSSPEAAKCLLKLYSAPEGSALRRMADRRIARHADALKKVMAAMEKDGRVPPGSAEDARLLIRGVMTLTIFEFQHSRFADFPPDFADRMARRIAAAVSAR
ncbi:MAG: helix-turn-helix domain-containing protein [Elusimicrobiales bacterium]|jgi:AcrR family transcriptional regulator|nr:helix-turn-helix domain-containing protein [Elusimicrobiales bacterium]